MKKISRNQFEDRIDKARGLKPCSLVIKGAKTLDVFSGQWLEGDVAIDDGVIVGVGEKYNGRQIVHLRGRHLVPGFIDSHVHVESTLMVPQEFEKAVLPCGTTTAILDPHEIVNVLGKQGLDYILACAEKAKMDLFVMLSSCVPATHLETSGARLLAHDLLAYKNHPRVLGLAEMMNYPGVLSKEKDVLEKIYEFQDVHIDGHAPTLRGKDLNAYLSCGIKTCHESVTKAEAQEKLERGMQVMLREGSVAKNLKELVGILTPFSSPHVSLCTDDRNPVDILDEGHLNYLIRLALKKGIAPHVVYRTASLSTAQCFGLKKKGALAPGYDADLVVLKDYKRCVVEKVIKAGEFVDANLLGRFPVDPPVHNSMRCLLPPVEQLRIKTRENLDEVRVIGVIEHSILTDDLSEKLKVDHDGILQPDTKKDILKIAVLERHGCGGRPAVGFVKGMGLKSGAIGSSVGHDSHNAVVVGATDEDIAACFSKLKELGGGFVAVKDGQLLAELALPIAGLMTDEPLVSVYKKLKKLRKEVARLGCRLSDPFLQMAFLCLPVIPQLKITDRGLVDVGRFEIVPSILGF